MPRRYPFAAINFESGEHRLRVTGDRAVLARRGVDDHGARDHARGGAGLSAVRLGLDVHPPPRAVGTSGPWKGWAVVSDRPGEIRVL